MSQNSSKSKSLLLLFSASLLVTATACSKNSNSPFDWKLDRFMPPAGYTMDPHDQREVLEIDWAGMWFKGDQMNIEETASKRNDEPSVEVYTPPADTRQHGRAAGDDTDPRPYNRLDPQWILAANNIVHTMLKNTDFSVEHVFIRPPRYHKKEVIQFREALKKAFVTNGVKVHSEPTKLSDYYVVNFAVMQSDPRGTGKTKLGIRLEHGRKVVALQTGFYNVPVTRIKPKTTDHTPHILKLSAEEEQTPLSSSSKPANSAPIKISPAKKPEASKPETEAEVKEEVKEEATAPVTTEQPATKEKAEEKVEAPQKAEIIKAPAATEQPKAITLPAAPATSTPEKLVPEDLATEIPAPDTSESN